MFSPKREANKIKKASQSFYVSVLPPYGGTDITGTVCVAHTPKISKSGFVTHSFARFFAEFVSYARDFSSLCGGVL